MTPLRGPLTASTRSTGGIHTQPAAWRSRAAAIDLTSFALLMLLLSVAMWCIGCSSGSGSSSSSSSASSSSAGSSAADSSDAANVEQRYVIGPAAARELDYRVEWQYGNAGTNVQHLSVQGPSIYAIDGSNVMSRIDRETGNKVWRLDIASGWENVVSVNVIPEAGRIYVGAGGSMLVLDEPTGTQVGRQTLEKIGNTGAARAGQYLLYGTRNGQLTWHAFSVGQPWRSYQISSTMKIAPIVMGSAVLGIGDDGTVMLLDIGTASQIWTKRLLDPVEAKPAVSQDAIYLAGLDQNLWALDPSTGRTMWNVLFDRPLTSPPTLIGDRVYQQVPGQGLACFDALPVAKPGGDRQWLAANIAGDVVARRRDSLLVWDAPARRMTMLDAARGTVVRVVDLPQVVRLMTDKTADGDLYALSDDGRLVRLVPR